jgi:uncharacterized protein YyaL (SSP411 family)
MNTLHNAMSPYLLQHADNPVHWQQWDEEVLKIAREKQKLIIVSIGYSTCHWCHVMAHESFEDQDTARIMNEYFINIKVDREERPDLDHYFMNAVQMMGVSGGWPLNVFLTPEGKPFFGGTYFPPEPKYGRPSWHQILISVHRAFNERNDQVLTSVRNLEKKFQTDPRQNNRSAEELSLTEVFETLYKYIDHENGGFGTAPKFPSTIALKFFIYYYTLTGEQRALDHVTKSIDKMILGGIYDHVGGGFCRYSVDSKWLIPHFEKMLYDHALIIEIIALLHKFKPQNRYINVIEQSLRFFDSFLESGGLLYSSIDADSEGEEGKFYSWNLEELQNILGVGFEVFDKHMNLIPFEDDTHYIITGKSKVEEVRLSFEDFISREECMNRLSEYRSKRIWPSIDNKIILAWNAMMVTTYCTLYRVSEALIYKDRAEMMLESLFQFRSANSHFHRIKVNDTYYGDSFLEDYSLLIHAVLQVYQLNHNSTLLERSKDLIKVVEKNFDYSNGLFSFTMIIENNQIPMLYDNLDHSIVNPNSLMAENYRILGLLTGDTLYSTKSEEMVNVNKVFIAQNIFSMSSWLIPNFELENGGLYIKGNLGKTQFAAYPGVIFEQKEKGIQENEICFQNSCHLVKDKIEESLALQGIRFS